MMNRLTSFDADRPRDPAQGEGGRGERDERRHHGRRGARRRGTSAGARSSTSWWPPTSPPASTGSRATRSARPRRCSSTTTPRATGWSAATTRSRSCTRTLDLFSSESFTAWDPDPPYRFVPTQIDPPEHIKYRQLLNPKFSPGAVARNEPAMRAIAARLVAELAPRGECDFVAEFAIRFPTEVFLDLIGLPTAGRRPPRAVGRRLLPRPQRRPRQAGGHGRRARRASAATSSSSSPSAGPTHATRRSTSSPTCSTRRSTASRSTRSSSSTSAPSSSSPASTRPAASSATSSSTSPSTPTDRRRLIDDPSLDRGRRRGVAARAVDHLRRLPQGDPRRRLPRLPGEEGRHGAWASSPRPTATRAATTAPTSSSSTARAPPTSASPPARTAASAPTSPARRCRSPSRSGSR